MFAGEPIFRLKRSQRFDSAIFRFSSPRLSPGVVRDELAAIRMLGARFNPGDDFLIGIRGIHPADLLDFKDNLGISAQMILNLFIP